MKGKFVFRSVGNFGAHEIYFTKDGLHKMSFSTVNDPVKFAALTLAPSIIQDGVYLGRTHNTKKDEEGHSNYDYFHHFMKKIKINGKEYEVIVDVGQYAYSKAMYEYTGYNVNHSGRSGFTEKIANITKYAINKDGVPIHGVKRPISRNAVFDSDSIAPLFEIVNIRIRKSA